jgi:hypothetical protein
MSEIKMTTLELRFLKRICDRREISPTSSAPVDGIDPAIRCGRNHVTVFAKVELIKWTITSRDHNNAGQQHIGN